MKPSNGAAIPRAKCHVHTGPRRASRAQPRTPARRRPNLARSRRAAKAKLSGASARCRTDARTRLPTANKHGVHDWLLHQGNSLPRCGHRLGESSVDEGRRREARRHARGRAERAHEFAVAEATSPRARDRAVAVDKQPAGVAQRVRTVLGASRRRRPRTSAGNESAEAKCTRCCSSTLSSSSRRSRARQRRRARIRRPEAAGAVGSAGSPFDEASDEHDGDSRGPDRRYPKRRPGRAANTMSSGSGGSAPRCQIAAPSPICSTSSGATRIERHSSPCACWWVQTNSWPGKPIITEPATSSCERPRVVQPKLPLRT